jgi:hypothetical protein
MHHFISENIMGIYGVPSWSPTLERHPINIDESHGTERYVT